MTVTYHYLVYGEIDRIMAYYESIAGPELADEFYKELRSVIKKTANDPELYSVR